MKRAKDYEEGRLGRGGVAEGKMVYVMLNLER